MSLVSRILSFFHKSQDRKQDELATQIVSALGRKQQTEKPKPANELLLRFFRNEQDEHIPHRLEDVERFADLDMERYHDFIQWIFPTIKPSENHPNAPVIDEHFAEQLCADECAIKNYCKTCRRYLNYLNFECDGNSNVCLLSKNSDSFIHLPYHNMLRITRMLASQNQTGHPQCSKAVYEMLLRVMRANPRDSYYDSRAASIDYWRKTQHRSTRKIIFLDFDDVMTTTKYCLSLNRQNQSEKDEYGVLFDPDCVAALKHIVDETNAEIVITSSWREVDMPMQRLKEMWESRHLPGTLADVTPSISQYRGEELAAWLTFCPDNCQYVIIDDLPQDQFLVNQYDHLVTTDGYAGLTRKLAEQAISILNTPMMNTSIYPCLGALVGDTVGSVYELNNIKTTDFPLFVAISRPTDDSVMTMAVAEWLLTDENRSQIKLEESMVKWAHLFPDAGYGPSFRKWLFYPYYKNMDLYTPHIKAGEEPEDIIRMAGIRRPYYSWGNGAAMRVSACGWVARTMDEAIDLARKSAIITHNHPEGVRGAQATAAAIFLARQGADKEEIRDFIEGRFYYDLHTDCDTIRPGYRWVESCQGTVPPAIVAFLESHDFESAIRLAVSLGGDSDTLACITGGIAQAYYKEIPESIITEMRNRLPEQFWNVIEQLEKSM